jgi:hypothetical protein
LDPIVTRYQLPDSWSGKAACLVCRTPGSLRVVHEEILPDRMKCSVCAAEFELESGGAHVRLLALPEALASRAPELLGAWLLPAEVPTIARPVTGALNEPFAPDLLPPAPATSAGYVDNLAADPLPPTAAPGTGPLGRETQPMAARPGTTRPLNLPKSYGTAPLSSTPGPKRTTITLTPHPEVLPAATPPPKPPAEPSANAGPPLDLNGLNKELDSVLGSLPERPAPSDEALADEVARLLGELPAATPVPPAAEAQSPESASGAATTPSNGATKPPAAQTGEPIKSAEVAAQKMQPPDNDDAEAPQLVLDSVRVAKFTEQGDKLRQFGNSLEVIRTTLERSGASPDEVRAALAGITQAEAARLKQFQGTLQWVAGIAIVILLVLVAIALVISRPAPPPAPIGLAVIHSANFTAITW